MRIRSEEWGMSVSILDAGLEMEELGDSISGLCNPENSILTEVVPLSAKVTPPTDDFCSCPPNQDAYLSDANDKQYSKYDSIECLAAKRLTKAFLNLLDVIRISMIVSRNVSGFQCLNGQLYSTI